MRTLRESDCSILPLVLKGKWYDMIASGKKKEEYRAAKTYWETRIENWQSARIDKRGDDVKLDVIAFSRGYRKADMFFRCSYIQRLRPQQIFVFHPAWGEPLCDHFVLGLGERVLVKSRTISDGT